MAMLLLFVLSMRSWDTVFFSFWRWRDGLSESFEICGQARTEVCGDGVKGFCGCDMVVRSWTFVSFVQPCCGLRGEESPCVWGFLFWFSEEGGTEVGLMDLV